MLSMRQNPPPQFLSHGVEVVRGPDHFLERLHVPHRLAVATDALLHRSNSVLVVGVSLEQFDVSDDHPALVVE